MDNRIRELDGLRALAVIAVIVDHLFVFSIQVPAPLDALLFWLGLSGVRYFFVLSGFVITRGLVAEQKSSGRISLRAFWIRRGWRILPALWIFLLVAGVAGLTGAIHTDAKSTLWSVLLVANILPVDWFHSHLWTLSVEEQFYLVGPMLAGCIGPRKRYLAATLTLLYLAFLFWHRMENLLGLFAVRASLEYLSMFRFIVAGVALGLLFPAIVKILSSLPAAMVALLAISTVYCGEGALSYWAKMAYQFAQPLMIATVIGWVALRDGRCQWLTAPPWQWLGRRSYSIYLWQQLFLSPVGMVAFTVTAGTRAASLVLILVCAAFSYHLVENPLTARGRRWAACAS